MNFYARTTASVLFSIFLSQPVLAQTFKMSCELEGVIPALEDRKLKPEKVVVEIQTMGKNLFMKVVGSNLYTVQASSLTTEEFAGKTSPLKNKWVSPVKIRQQVLSQRFG
jgi:hypothetical protein